MRSVVFALLVCSALAFAQDSIPPGTILPIQLNSSLKSSRSKAGQIITGRIMQDVPVSSGKTIHAGAKVVGHILNVVTGKNGSPAEITVRFDELRFAHKSLPVATNLRALASMMDVEDAQVPSVGTDRGSPWAWMSRTLIGGEVAYGQGGPVARGDEIVGEALYGGVLLPARATPGTPCHADVGDGSRLQAMWVFSSDACGVYDIDDVEITHAGRTDPVGQITLGSKQGDVNVRSGSGMLLRVISEYP